VNEKEQKTKSYPEHDMLHLQVEFAYCIFDFFDRLILGSTEDVRQQVEFLINKAQASHFLKQRSIVAPLHA